MRKIVLGFVAIALLGCNAHPAADMQHEALKVYMRCLRGAARALDDHRSDASDIAAAVANRCSGQRPFVAKTMGDVPQEITMATTIVLAERNKASK